MPTIDVNALDIKQQGVRHTLLPAAALIDALTPLRSPLSSSEWAALALGAPPSEWPTAAPFLPSQIGMTPLLFHPVPGGPDGRASTLVVCEHNLRQSGADAFEARSPASGAWVPLPADEASAPLLAAMVASQARRYALPAGARAELARAPSVSVDPRGDGWMTSEERATEVRLGAALRDYAAAHFHERVATSGGATAAPAARTLVVLSRPVPPATKGFVVHAVIHCADDAADGGPARVWSSQHAITVTPLRDAIKCDITAAVAIRSGGGDGASSSSSSYSSGASATFAYSSIVNIADTERATAMAQLVAAVGELVAAAEARAQDDFEAVTVRARQQLGGSLRTAPELPLDREAAAAGPRDHAVRESIRSAFEAVRGRGKTGRGAAGGGAWSESKAGEVAVVAAPGFGSVAPSLAASPNRAVSISLAPSMR